MSLPLRIERPPAPILERKVYDFDHLVPFFSRWNGRLEQISSGPFEGHLQVVHGRLLRSVRVAFNQVLLVRGQAAPGMYSVYLTAERNAGALWQGRRLRPNQFVVHGPDTEVDHRSPRRSEVLGLSVRADVIERVARQLQLDSGGPVPRGWAAYEPSPDRYDLLDRTLRRLLTRAVANPALLATAEGRDCEQECLRLVVTTLFPPTAAARPVLSLPGRTHLVRRAEDLMRATLREPLGGLDLCELLGVSDRTLRLAFRDRFGLGPMAYYRALRLNAVRAALTTPDAPPVSAVARTFGFHHLGNFSADYRRLFGELPSRTRLGDESRRLLLPD